MIIAGRPAKILLIDTNVYFSKRLTDALKREGFAVTASTQPAFALTTLEYDAPSAIVCSTNMREMGALDIARMIRADAKNAAMPVIALGDGSQRALMEAFQAGCDDYIDRTRPPAVIASHIRDVIVSKSEGFQPTQMLAQADTSLSGSLTHHDLPGVMQMLGHAHQTGALHINSGDTDALLFFDGGSISHAECGALFGDEAVIHILKSCCKNNSGVYKFVYASASAQRTVLRSPTDLMLDAMREVDESAHQAQETPSLQAAVEERPATAHDGSDGDSELSNLAASSNNSIEPVASEPADSAPETEEPSLLHRMDSFDPVPPKDAAALANESESILDGPEILSIETENASNEPETSADRNTNELFSSDPFSELVAPLPQIEITSPANEVNEAHADANEIHETDAHQAIESAAAEAKAANIAEADQVHTDEADEERIDEANEAERNGALEAASANSNEFGIQEPGEVFNYPPSEGYFFADRRQAEESSATASDDFSAITEALDRFAIRHSDGFSAATSDDCPGVVPPPDNASNESARDENSFEVLSGTDLHQESAAGPATPNSEVPATDDSSVATRSEGGL